MTRSGGSWLDPLLDPAPLVAKATGSADVTARIGLALLLEAQFALYASIGHRAGWPEFGTPAGDGSSAELRLLAAVARVFADEPDAASELLDLAASGEPADLSLVAAVLASVAYSLRDELRAAREILDVRLAASSDALERRLLLTHLGLRAAEDDDVDDAITKTREARGDDEPTSGNERLLWVVATLNLRSFEQRLPPDQRTIDPYDLPLRSAVPAVSRSEMLLATGLDDYLKAEFESALVNPYARSILWRAQDPVEQGLLGALLRGECLADWNAIGFSRISLGRYRVLAGVGRSEEALAEAFDLFRRAGDDKSLGGAARMILRLGPLSTLRQVVAATVDARWTWVDTIPRLALLVNAADVLKPDEAARALKRVLEPECFLRNLRLAADAAAALLTVAPLEAHTDTARRLLDLAESHADSGAVMQSLPRTLRALRFGDLNRPTRGPWLQYVRDRLGRGGEPGLLAQAVAVLLAASEPDAIAVAAGEAFVQRPTLDTVAVFLDADVELPPEVAEDALELALESLSQIRERAARGSYGLGGVSVPLVVFELLQSIDRPEGWQTLIDFLIDPNVDMAEKTRALDAMARPEAKIDFTAAAGLKSQLGGLTAVSVDPGASDDAFKAAALRLALKLDAASGSDVLAELLRLSGSDKPFARIQAARTLPAATHAIGGEVAITLALRLTDDPHPDVRAHAARALASRFAEVDEPLATVVHARLQVLLKDPGSLVPQATIAGLYDGYRADRPPPWELALIIGQLQHEHPSHGVGQAATQFHNLSSGTATPR
jgi:hypothetical protein